MAKEKNNEENLEEAKVESPKESFHFSGMLKYVPITIKAKDLDEASEIWEKKRQLIK